MTISLVCSMPASTIGAAFLPSPKTSSIPKPLGRKSPACKPKPNLAASSFANAWPSTPNFSPKKTFFLRAFARKRNSSLLMEEAQCRAGFSPPFGVRRLDAAFPTLNNTDHETVQENHCSRRRRWRFKTPPRSLRRNGPAPVDHHRQHRRRHHPPRPENFSRPGHSHVHIGGSSRPQKRLGPSLRNFSRPETLSRLWPAQLV